ncbi:hypothetical protein DXT88_01750 [Herbaspirillum lusitanum]|uniref:hypothetical protein n=1 Tax=Herbaspirillum lusitanum TaxID=213312 RepID=UPI002236FAB2|nr:hypothetical protein [Herbaspirillum lusitanum]MCW5296893.1 hypothetical protein [Herbaspirillum lusitanum]
MQVKPHYFCTLFDSGYLFKGVAMLRSLAQHCPNANVFVLCMDEQTQRILERLNLTFITCIPLRDIENDDLRKAKADRGVAEYCWTLSPCLPHYVLEKNPDIDFITYLDADLLFYSSIAPLFEEIGSASIAIIEHRFSPRLQDREVNGRFCVEWVSFRRDEQGMACLNRWREQCIEWCYYRLEEGRMGDQKYLDEWPERYSSCHILLHPGAGIAPWNYSQYYFDLDGAGHITVDGSPLIFYHFHQFQLLESHKFDRLSSFYTSECKEPELIYDAYEQELTTIIGEVTMLFPSFKAGLKPISTVTTRRWIQQFVPMWFKEIARKFIRY